METGNRRQECTIDECVIPRLDRGIQSSANNLDYPTKPVPAPHQVQGKLRRGSVMTARNVFPDGVILNLFQDLIWKDIW
jgi:hypothetical protein